MFTRRLCVLCSAFGSWVATAGLLAAPIGHPTPPPCSADGTCVPARATWGYHRTQWRLWPGTSIDDALPGDEAALGSDYIGPTAKPERAVEDKQAPPKVEALEPESEAPDAGGTEFELPEMDMEDAAPGERQPAEPDGLAPPRPGFMDRVPGGLPFDEPAEEAAPAVPRQEPALPFGQPPAAPLDRPTPPADLFPSNMPRRMEGPSLGDDRPPALPFAMQQGVQQQSPQPVSGQSLILPAAGYQSSPLSRPSASRIPVEISRPRVERAAAVGNFSDAPPHMPQGLFGNR